MIKPLQYLQFPFRFILSMIPGAVFISLKWLPHAKSKFAFQTLFIIGLTCAVIYSEELAFYPREKPVAEILEHHLLARPEYQTRWMEAEGIDYHLHIPQAARDMPMVMVAEGKGTASLTAQDSRTLYLHADITSDEATLAIKRFYFPGWMATNDLSVNEYKALLSVQVPKGSHDIILSLPWLAGEREGVIISLGSMIILLAFLAFSRLQDYSTGRITSF